MSILKSFVVLVAIGLIGAIGYLSFEALTNQNQIISFADCVSAGYPVSETLPAECKTPDGQTFRDLIPEDQINSFSDCAAAGYPVMESYPRQCATPGGKSFTENIGNQLDKSNLIRVTSPTPNTEIQSPLLITGAARGQWFFEASFPITIVDANGKELTRTFVEATSDWMTEEFVPFSSAIEFTTSTTKTGKIILEKSNASGLPEHNDQLIIPITFAEVQTISSNDRATGGCIISGCSSQVCSDQEVVTDCAYKEIYACYQTAICGRSQTGQCEWQDSPALTQCLADTDN